MYLEKRDLYDGQLLILFITFYTICVNFIGDVLDKKTINLLTNNFYAKHFIVFLIIYYNYINFDKTSLNKHPLENIIESLKLWLFFFLFTKSGLYSKILIVLLIFASELIKNSKKYYINREKTDQPLKSFGRKILNIDYSIQIRNAIFIIILMSNINLFMKKYNKF
jgi:hypothetical protein